MVTRTTGIVQILELGLKQPTKDKKYLLDWVRKVRIMPETEKERHSL